MMIWCAAVTKCKHNSFRRPKFFRISIFLDVLLIVRFVVDAYIDVQTKLFAIKLSKRKNIMLGSGVSKTINWSLES